MSLEPIKNDDEIEVGMEGNPNIILIQKKGEKEDKKKIKKEKEEEEDELKPIEKEKEVIISTVERDRIITFENRLFPALSEALLPLYTFVGFLEAESGKRIYYRYNDQISQEEKQNPLVKGCQTIQEFKNKNNHLGFAILQLIDLPDPMVKPEVIVKANISDLYRRYVNPDYPFDSFDAEEGFPVRLWKLLPLTSFQYILSVSSYGAIHMAALELKKDLKTLIISEDVNFLFAQFVCKKYISPKQNAFASGLNGDNAQFRVASGFRTTVVANAKWMMAFKLHFEKNIVEVVEDNTKKAQSLYLEYHKNTPNTPDNYKSLDDQQISNFYKADPERYERFYEFVKKGIRKVYKEIKEIKL